MANPEENVDISALLHSLLANLRASGIEIENRLTANQPTADQPNTDQPTAIQPAADQPTTSHTQVPAENVQTTALQQPLSPSKHRHPRPGIYVCEHPPSSIFGPRHHVPDMPAHMLAHIPANLPMPSAAMDNPPHYVNPGPSLPEDDRRNAAALELQCNPEDIKTWPLALKYTSILFTYNPDIPEQIRDMIAAQRSQEKAWVARREDLVRQHANQEHAHQQFQQILNLGNNPSYVLPWRDLAVDIEKHDKMVHGEYARLQSEGAIKLANLKIPLFCMRRSLIDAPPEIYDPVAQLPTLDYNVESTNRTKGLVSLKELKELQIKMIDFLEEYCKA